MSLPSSILRRLRRRRISATACVCLAWFGFAAGILQASPTIQIYLGGDLDVPEGTVGILVADRAGNGFHPLNHVTAIGTRLAVGEAVGLSDDVIVGVVQASDQGFAGPGSGFTGILRNLPYPPHQLSPGTALCFYWFPDHLAPGERLANGDTFESFRTDQLDSGSGGEMIFALPARHGVHTLSFVSPADGGGFSLRDPGASGTYATGLTGTSTAPPNNPGPIDLPGTGTPGTTYTDSGFTPDHQGRYIGLITEPGSRFAGEIRGFVSPQGLATVTLLVDGRRYVIRGTFDSDTGEFTEIENPAANGSAPTLEMQLATSGSGAPAITGTVAVGDENLDIVLSHSSSPADSSGLVEPGRYTLVLPTDPTVDPQIVPGGNGFGLVTVLPNGRILATLMLGDGTPVSDATFLDGDGIWNLFQPVYGRNGGFIAGQLIFRNEDNVGDLDGPVHWKKEAEPRPNRLSRYPLGFELALHAVGSRYEVPGLGERVLSQVANGEDNAIWETGTSLLDPSPSVIPVTWLPDNRLLPFNNGDERLRVLLQIQTGQVVTIHNQLGTDPNGRPVNRRIVTRGVALQKQGLVAGLSLLPGATDHFTLRPAATPTLVLRNGSGVDLAPGAILDFGDIGLDGGVGERIVELVNTGGGNLLLPDVPQLDGQGFSLVADRAGYLAPGESSCLRIRFVPAAEGVALGNLTILSNDRDHNPYGIQLTGNGLANSDVSNVEGGDSTLTDLAVDLSSTPTGTFDPAIHSGWFRGVVLTPDGGEISLFVNSVGLFTGTARIGGALGRFRGTAETDGSLTVTFFRGPLSLTHTLSNLHFVTLTDGGTPAITADLENIESGEILSLVLIHTTGRDDITDSQTGRFTMILPAMEDLGAGYPSGDGVAVVLIRPNGLVNVQLLLADRQRRSLTTRLEGSGDDLGWSFHDQWRLGQISGRVVFAVSGEADFQGTAHWQRFPHSRQLWYPDGFSVEVPVLGSAYAFVPGERMLPIPGGASDEVAAEVTGNFDPTVPGQALHWDDRNVFADDVPDDGIFRLNANRRTGWISGTFVNRYVDGDGRNLRQLIRVDGVVFQRQDLVTGNSAAPDTHGFFGLTPQP
ncbi:MAG: hypothetical protein KDN19_00155 [Verrucomicrobiae bacterium]|nr:hypothetical protein [Verrucomicrobiae bacterium]